MDVAGKATSKQVKVIIGYKIKIKEVVNMTYEELKATAGVFLTGDNVLPLRDPAKMQAMVSSAYKFAAKKCTALKLLTTTREDSIIRMGPGNTYVRKPKLPVNDTDVLDIDDELGDAIARIMAYQVAKDTRTKDYHKREALELMRDYEGIVQEFIEETKRRGDYEDIGEDV